MLRASSRSACASLPPPKSQPSPWLRTADIVCCQTLDANTVVGSSGTASALPPRLVSGALEARRAVTSGRIRVAGINSTRGGETVRNARLLDGDALTFGFDSLARQKRAQGAGRTWCIRKKRAKKRRRGERIRCVGVVERGKQHVEEK